MSSLLANRLPAWRTLDQLASTRWRQIHLRDLFQQDPNRAQRYQVEAAGLHLDYSKNLIDDHLLETLCTLAQEAGLTQQIEAMFQGEAINNTEQRAALHVALRQSSQQPVLVDGKDVIPEVQQTLTRVCALADQIHDNQYLGYSGQPIEHVVNIGIGGSYLGPKVVDSALTPFHHPRLSSHYVANIDGTDISRTLAQVRPDNTLFVVASKSFTTQETLTNALSARRWFIEQGAPEAAVAQHFVAVSSNVEKAVDFGIDPDQIYPMWDWVGGRYSLWSAIGLPVALMLGSTHFRALLAGAEAMDQHFRHSPLRENMPVLMGLLGIWYGNFLDAESHVVLPYDHYLRALPAHLQQLDMESNGKRVTRGGETVEYPTGPVLWGGPGTNGQHAYHQLLHQGERKFWVDFIVPMTGHHPLPDHHDMLVAHAMGQAQAFLQGKTLDEASAELRASGLADAEVAALAPHKVIPGNKPSNFISVAQSNPATVGALIALYEHTVLVKASIWGINAFDQWGVELGKQLASPLLRQLQGDSRIDSGQDSSTQALIARYRHLRRGG